MADRMTIDVDASGLIAMLDRLGAVAEKHISAAAKTTADAVAREARARVARATGDTMRGITIDTAKIPTGYVVFVNQPDNPGLAGWLEFGTKHMRSRPFLFTSAR